MDDMVAHAARTAGELLAAEYGAQTRMQVEAALSERSRRPDSFLDPVSLGALIVSTAALAWNVYVDLRRSGAKPPDGSAVRMVQIRLDHRDDSDAALKDRIVEIVVADFDGKS